MLFTPDLLHYWLSGAKVSERSIASTSQCLSVHEDVWLSDLLAKLDIPAGIFSPVVPSGTVLGELLPDIAEIVGQTGMKVITPPSHDTASAVVATPLSSPHAAYLSCGTWSLLGIESQFPVATPAALEAGLTNEKGIGASYRLLKNIMGLITRIRQQLFDVVSLAERIDASEGIFKRRDPLLRVTGAFADSPHARWSAFRGLKDGRRAIILGNLGTEPLQADSVAFADNPAGRLRVYQAFTAEAEVAASEAITVPGERVVFIVEVNS